MKHLFKLSLLFLCVVAIGFYSAISYSQNDIKGPTLTLSNSKNIDNFNSNEFIKDIVGRVKKDYVEEKTERQLAEAAASGILSSLDPHSSYLNEDDFKEMQVQTKGEFGGIGVEITLDHSVVKVISAIEGTPADKAGIKSGDYISKVDGQSVIGIPIEDVVKKMRGKPGTKVTIVVLRKGEKAPLDFIIYRQSIQIKAIRANRKGNIAYIKINSFSEQADVGAINEVKKLIAAMGGKNKIKGLVLDLRNNPGGLLDQAVKVSDLFLDKNMTIVSIKGRNSDENKIYKDDSNQSLIPGIPMAVLVNEGSASASEIVAGALQDNKRAVILGNKSFGKGSVQSLIPLGDKKGAIKMTTALYYTPSGKSIQANGIEPDIIVTEAKIEKTTKNDDDPKSEASLNGHIAQQVNDAIEESKKSQINDDNLDSYNEDYQLARAIDLLRGISIYKEVSE
jgi:carboxyl-terminal processing protease